MRICFIANLYPPYAKGGAETVVSEEARALSRQGHQVTVITSMPLPDDGDPRVRTADEDGVRVHRFYPLNLFHYGELGRHNAAVRTVWHAWDAGNPFTTTTVGQLLADERPDVVHTHNLKGIGFGVVRAIRKLGLRHVHTLHDVQLAVPSGLIIKGREAEAENVINAAYASVMRRLMGSPDVVLSPSRFLMRFYEERGFFPRSQKVLLSNPAPEAKSDRTEGRATSKETRFLFLGQVETHKGIFLLIEAMKRLLAEGVPARLDVVGVGSQAEAAVSAAGHERRIAFFGRKQPAQFPAMFSAADFTVVPSLCYENAPTVVLESFAYGVPVLAADVGGAAELIRDDANGFRFEAGSVESLLAAMRRACDAKRRWKTFSREAVSSAAPHLVDRHIDRLLHIYDGSDDALDVHEPVVPVRYGTV